MCRYVCHMGVALLSNTAVCSMYIMYVAKRRFLYSCLSHSTVVLCI